MEPQRQGAYGLVEHVNVHRAAVEVRSIVDAAEQLADELRRDAEAAAEQRLREADAEVQRRLEHALQEAESIREEGRHRLSEGAAELAGRVNELGVALDEAVVASRRLTEVVVAARVAAERLTGDGGASAAAPASDRERSPRTRDAHTASGEEPGQLASPRPTGKSGDAFTPAANPVARLVAAQMGQAGSSRADAAEHLGRVFGLAEDHSILDDVFGDAAASHGAGQT